MQIALNGPAYRLPQLQQSCQRCVNLMLQVAEKPSKSASMLIPTPGLALRQTLPVGPTRGAIVSGGSLWVVSGRNVYRLNATYAATYIGQIQSESGPVALAANGPQILIVDGVTGYILTVATSALTQITDPAFPLGVTSATFIDQYFVVTGNDTGQFWWSDLGDGSSWNGLDFASAEGAPDNAVAVVADHRELWVFGENTIEVFAATENGFERLAAAVIEEGVAAVASVGRVASAILWLGQSENGGGVVWAAHGFQPQRVSTHAIENAIAEYPRIDDAVAWTYSDRGHDFYAIHFPSGDATWVYDVAVGEWHERAWRDPVTGLLHRHRGAWHVYYGRDHVVGDWEDGRVYVLSHEATDDAGDLILHLRSTQAAADTDSYGVMLWGRMQVDVVSGVGTATGQGRDPQLMMRYSDTGGHRWSNRRSAPIGRTGEYWARCKFERCFPGGSADGRSRVWEVSWTDPVITALIGAAAFVDRGGV